MKTVKYNTEVYIWEDRIKRLVAVIPKESVIGEKRFWSALCPECFVKKSWVSTCTENGWVSSRSKHKCSL